MSFTASVQDSDNPFGQMISGFFAQEFPGANSDNKQNLLESVTAAFVSTNNIRFGPAPNPESLVAIREVIRRCIDEKKPIPVLTPFGSKKTRNGESVDVAEIVCLKQLNCLRKRVQAFYKPGIQVNIRLEDTSGYYLFHDEGEAARESTRHYCADFQTLVRVLGLRGFVNPILESALFEEAQYFELADAIFKPMLQYLDDTDSFGLDGYQSRPSWTVLSATGWKGCIPKEQRDYYYARYKSLYPGISPYDAAVKLARYLAGSLARIKCKGVGADSKWGQDYLRVTFVNPVPGAPASICSKNIYYRTVPLKMAATHMPPWRAKGYLKIGTDVKPKLATWNEQLEFTKCEVVFQGEGESVSVRTDFVLE